MPEIINEIEHAGRTWLLKLDSRGRPYGHLEGHGRVSVDLFKRAKKHKPLSDFEP